MRRLLEEGNVETVNLMEQIAIDQGALLESVLPSATGRRQELQVPKLVQRMWAGGRVLLDSCGVDGINVARERKSDTARSWGAMAIGLEPELTLNERLFLAAISLETTTSVCREWAWIARRKHIVTELALALDLLSEWAHDSDPLVRRFASESTRPREAPCVHIAALKADPEMAIGVLEPLCSDPAVVRAAFRGKLAKRCRKVPTRLDALNMS